jgi:hypothetical protein
MGRPHLADGPITDDGYFLPLPIWNIFVPQVPQVPLVAGLPFFIVTAVGSFISLFALHLTQYASIYHPPYDPLGSIDFTCSIRYGCHDSSCSHAQSVNLLDNLETGAFQTHKTRYWGRRSSLRMQIGMLLTHLREQPGNRIRRLCRTICERFRKDMPPIILNDL